MNIPRRRTRTNAAFLLAGLLACGVAFAADAPDPDPSRFSQEIDAFALWDSKNAVPENALLFVGSSSIRYWPTALAFPGKPVVNRGFGGSEISDAIHFYDRVIAPYAAAKIFLYAGDNDIANGKSAGQVFEDYKELAARVRADFPETELIFLSIKPSKARWNLWPVMAEANAMVRKYAETDPKLGYVDLATPLLGDDGRPKDVYVQDDLHLNEQGYRLWQKKLAPLLEPPAGTDEKPPVVEVFACGDNCPGAREQYLMRVYQGVSDKDECLALGGRPYVYFGWRQVTLCLAQ